VPLSEIGVERWQYDLWFQIIRAALDGHAEQVDLAYHPALQLPAMSRYAMTTRALERWFKGHNAQRAYEDQVKPFNFMCGFQASPLAATGEETFALDAGSKLPRKRKQRPLRPIAPYSRSSKEASTQAFDRETGEPVRAEQLKTYVQALAQYHLRPEAKFENGDYFDSGPTRRRHVHAIQIIYIGKEANRWEEQLFLGMDEDAEIDYGADPNAAAGLFGELTNAIGKFGKQQVASRIGVSRNTVAQILGMKCQKLSSRISQKIISALAVLNSHSCAETDKHSNLLELARDEVAKIGLSEFARRLQLNKSNLKNVLDGRRKGGRRLLKGLVIYFN
jgi:hypothetical protein